MWSSSFFWIVLAIMLFWTLGAHNRLVRLRSALVKAFGSVDANMIRRLALINEWIAAGGGASLPLASPGIAALQGACAQLGASLAVARTKPLNSEAMAALSAARDVLGATWHSVTRDATQMLNADGVRETERSPDIGTDAGAHGWQSLWDEHLQEDAQTVQLFNDAVARYNAAIAQFPVSCLAWLFGFKAARDVPSGL